MPPVRDVLIVLAVYLAVGTAAALARPYLHLSAGATSVAAVVVTIAVLFTIFWRKVGREDAAREAAHEAARLARGPYVSPYEVRFDDAEVVVTEHGAPDERVAWADLLTVGVRIDEGFLPQPWWLLFSRSGQTASYPGEARGAKEMLAELQRRLPGFDNAAVVRAMGMMEGGVVVWEKPVSPPAAARDDDQGGAGLTVA